jgi:hypothetical protein
MMDVLGRFVRPVRASGPADRGWQDDVLGGLERKVRRLDRDVVELRQILTDLMERLSVRADCG